MKNSITLKDLIIEMGRQAGNSHELGAGIKSLLKYKLKDKYDLNDLKHFKDHSLLSICEINNEFNSIAKRDEYDELFAGFEFLFEVLLTGLTDGEKEN